MGTTYSMVVTREGQSYRDMRGDALADAMWGALQLPAALFYQPDNVPAHMGAVRVGDIYTLDVADDGAVAMTGEFFDGRPNLDRLQGPIAEAIELARSGSIWPSVDPNVIQVGGAEGEGAEPVTAVDIAGVTLVSTPGFTGTTITILGEATAPEETGNTDAAEVYGSDDAPAPVVAAVNSGPEDGYPVAPRDHPWDGAAAAERVAAHCGVDDAAEGEDGEPWACYGNAFLYRDNEADPATKGAYKLGVVDVLDGEFTLIPEAVIAVAAVLQGARGGADIPADEQEQLRGVVSTLYERVNEATGADLTPPWDDDADDGEDDDDAAAVLIAAALATVREPMPNDAFAEPDLPGYQPGYRIEGRRFYGHITNVAACHRNVATACLTPPESPSDYQVANRYAVMTDTGALEVGRVTSGFGLVGTGCECHAGRNLDDHYCPNERSAAATIAHYDQLTTIADVLIGQNESGSVWAAGILRDGLPAAAARVLDRRVWSGDWRPWGTGSEMVEVLALTNGLPGFTNRTKHDMGFTLIAAAGPGPEHRAAAEPSVREVVREELARERAAGAARRNLATTATRSSLAAITRK